MVLIYHPDKQPDNQFAQQHFIELKAAYDILSDDKKRAAYDYELWLSGKMKNNANRINNPEIILSSVKELNQYLQSVDKYSISYSKLADYILLLLSDKNIGLLLQQNDNQNLHSFTAETLSATDHLPFGYTKEIIEKLHSFTAPESKLKILITTFEKRKYKKYVMQKIFPFSVISIAILLCVAMYFLR